MAGGVRRLALAGALVLAGCASNPSPGMPEAASLMQVDAAAETAYRDGRHAQAIEGYESLVRQMPTDAGYWYRLGNAYFRGGRYAEATMAYEQSLSLDASNPRAWHNLGVALATQARDAFNAGAAASPSVGAVAEHSRRFGAALENVLSRPLAGDQGDEASHAGGRYDETASPRL